MKKIILTICFLLISRVAVAAPDYSAIVNAIWKAEGGLKSSVPYGIMYKGCDWEHEDFCRQISINTVRNQWGRHSKHNHDLTYLECLAERYAPKAAHPLNKNWLPNVKYFLNLKEV